MGFNITTEYIYIYTAIIKYLIRNGSKMGQYIGHIKLQESL
jgi:hypothetical protein